MTNIGASWPNPDLCRCERKGSFAPQFGRRRLPLRPQKRTLLKRAHMHGMRIPQVADQPMRAWNTYQVESPRVPFLYLASSIRGRP
jgi:hypothetical protein